jgi:hypothetical protein
MVNGQADEIQQKKIFALLIKKLCRYHDSGFIPNSADKTAFTAGRRHVAELLIFLTNTQFEELLWQTQQ